jgi:hypothetical protein
MPHFPTNSRFLIGASVQGEKAETKNLQVVDMEIVSMRKY